MENDFPAYKNQCKNHQYRNEPSNMFRHQKLSHQNRLRDLRNQSALISVIADIQSSQS